MSLTAHPWFASFRSAPRRPRQKIAGRRPRSRRLFLEPLEDRTLLAASIRGGVWNDLIPDGVRAGGEPRLAGVAVILDHSGSHTQALTNGAGEYSFTGLAAGTYTVGIIVPDGASLTFSDGGAVQVT